MHTRKSLLLIKPDAVQRRLVGKVIARLEEKGLQLIAIKMIKPTDAIAKKHYATHAKKPFFPELIRFITSGPLVAIVVDGNDSISVVRNIVGSTDGREASPGTIRGDYGLSYGANIIHASDAVETAKTEIDIWFPEGVVNWTPCDKLWLDTH